MKCGNNFHLTKACAGIQDSSWNTKPPDSKKNWRCKDCRDKSSRESSLKRSRHDLSFENDNNHDESDYDHHSPYPTLNQIRDLLDATFDSKLNPMEDRLREKLRIFGLQYFKVIAAIYLSSQSPASDFNASAISRVDFIKAGLHAFVQRANNKLKPPNILFENE